MKFFIITSLVLVLQGCSKKSEIIHGKICPFCFADNPSWRGDFCGTCLAWDRDILIDNNTLAQQ